MVMLILERSVTKEFWTTMYEYLERRIKAGRAEPVGRTGVVRIEGGPCTLSYAICANGHPVAWLYLGRRPQWATWEVRQVWVFPELRGHGLAQRIYRAAVNVDQIILSSGKTQSKTSRALWQRFIEKDTFNIWAQDFNNLRSREPVWCQDGELECKLPVYQRHRDKHDVRLIAIKK